MARGGEVRAAGLPPVEEPDQARLLELLGRGARELDALVHTTGWSAARVALLLVQLELSGYVLEEGGRYRRI